MTPRWTTDYAKNYCNRTLIVKVIVENVVTCFFMGHRVLVSDAMIDAALSTINSHTYRSDFTLTEKNKKFKTICKNN